MKRDFSDFLKRKKQEYGSKFDPSDLVKDFIPYYENGKRIKVDMYIEGKVVSGTVGVTMGWKPAFLLMRTSRSVGSTYILTKKDKIVGEVKSR
jgi:hypothetical protein